MQVQRVVFYISIIYSLPTNRFGLVGPGTKVPHIAKQVKR